MYLPTGSVLHALAGAFGGYFGTKVYATNVKHGAHFYFLLFDAATAKPLAQFEANYLGQIRTGAASGLAVDLLARPDVSSLAVIGSGFQAESQLAAMRAVRPFRDVRVWSRKAEKRQAFAQATGARASASARDAVEGADVVVTATWSKDPVLEASWVKHDAVVCAIGSNDPKRREIPGELVRGAGLLVADDIEQCKAEGGDFAMELDEAGWAAVVPLASVVAGNSKAGHFGRPVVFKSVGLGLEDVAAAAAVYEKSTLAR
jgi:ornithine cyclodeaminase/alanine dehydrogenase-like protein (mu-crystallin family)